MTKTNVQILKDNLIHLLQNQSVSKIYVNDLIANADMSRSSFYRNYDDLDSFYKEIVFEYLAPIEDIIDKDNRNKNNALETKLFSIFAYIDKNKDLSVALFLEKEYPLFYHKIKILFFKLLKKHSTQQKNEYVYKIFSNALIGLIREWCQETTPVNSVKNRKIMKKWLTPFLG